MAEGDEENEDLQEEVQEKPAGSKKKLIVIIAVVLVLLIGGGVGAFFMLGDKGGDKEVATANVDGDEEQDEEDEAEDTEEDSGAAQGEAVYFSLDPPFVVNFSGKSRARFLQVSIEGLTRSAKVKEDITKHFPQIRNNLVLLLSAQTYDELSTQEGKAALRKSVLKEIQKVLENETGKEGVEDVFFTSFVMQ